ncbi:hypothetical protein IG631_14863 [Alternaria alternata]|nr:hypothetical protein IG631_14863 [Alternaria alternata]
MPYKETVVDRCHQLLGTVQTTLSGLTQYAPPFQAHQSLREQDTGVRISRDLLPPCSGITACSVYGRLSQICSEHGAFVLRMNQETIVKSGRQSKFQRHQNSTGSYCRSGDIFPFTAIPITWSARHLNAILRSDVQTHVCHPSYLALRAGPPFTTRWLCDDVTDVAIEDPAIADEVSSSSTEKVYPTASYVEYRGVRSLVPLRYATEGLGKRMCGTFTEIHADHRTRNAIWKGR